MNAIIEVASAVAVEAPLKITQVTCLEDRAQVQRRGELSLAAGSQRVRVPGVSAVAVDRSLKVELTGATLVDGGVRRQWKQKPPIAAPETTVLRQREKDLHQQILALAAEVMRLGARLEVIRDGKADLMRAIAETTGAGAAKPDGWTSQLERVRLEESRTEEELRRMGLEQQRANVRLQETRQAIARAERPEEDLETWVELTVEVAQAGPVSIGVSYLVPCAVWRPAYRATLLGKDGAEVVSVEADAVVWQKTGEDWTEIELLLSTARPTLGASPPVLTDDVLTLRPKTEQEKKVVSVSVREEVIATVGAGRAAEAEMPGLDDGGEVRLLTVPQRTSIPCDGQPHRVHLSRFEAPAKSELLCTPEKSALASLVARFENRGRSVLLAGPVELARKSGFVGKGQLKFAGQGELVTLSFGSEDGLRVGRSTLNHEDESRLTGRKTTRRTVQLFASNFGGEAARLVIEERIPVSEVKEVEISGVKDATLAPTSVSKDGIVRFELTLGARQNQELKFSYEISASSKVSGI